MNFNNPDDALSSSPYSDGSTADVDVSPPDHHSESGNSPSDRMDIDSPEDSQHGTPRLLQRSNTQNTNSIEEQADDDRSMELVGDEVTAAFQPWANRHRKSQQSSIDVSAGQENVNPFSPAFKTAQLVTENPSPAQSAQEMEDMSMDITRAIGGIVRASPSRRKSAVSRRRSSDANSALGGKTMEFTTAVGGIQSATQGDNLEDPETIQDEELSMEFTSIFGGIQNKDKRRSMVMNAIGRSNRAAQDHTNLTIDVDGDMEMTTAVGRIVDSSENDHATPSKEDDEMDMTRAVGGIINSGRSASIKSPLRNAATSMLRAAVTTASNGSPSLLGRQDRSAGRKSDSVDDLGTPSRGIRTPEKQITPQPPRPTTPNKTPTPNVAMRHPSPKKLFQNEIRQAKSSPVVRSPGPGLFDHDQVRGTHTPRIRLAPKTQVHRRASGVGFDKVGLGSPQVAALLDRRASIGDQADVFVPQSLEQRGVRFQDPRELELEAAKEHEEDERRERGQSILQHEADEVNDERDATITLKEAIIGMSPKKHKLNGRKSLAVGGAKGLLGKRPAELDDDDEDDEDGTPTGLRGREPSPVKRIRLQAPPTISETTRRNESSRVNRGTTFAIERPTTPVHGSPRNRASTPTHQGHFRDVNAPSSTRRLSTLLRQKSPSIDAENLLIDDGSERIGLQDFLNLTTIRFMELNTTKRRHTAAPKALREEGGDEDKVEVDPTRQFCDAVVAGACTLPMLELYQHVSYTHCLVRKLLC